MVGLITTKRGARGERRDPDMVTCRSHHYLRRVLRLDDEDGEELEETGD